MERFKPCGVRRFCIDKQTNLNADVIAFIVQRVERCIDPRQFVHQAFLRNVRANPEQAAQEGRCALGILAKCRRVSAIEPLLPPEGGGLSQTLSQHLKGGAIGDCIELTAT